MLAFTCPSKESSAAGYPNIFAAVLLVILSGPATLTLALICSSAKRAGVEKYIRFSVMDARKFTCQQKYGVLLSNPPYGERLSDEKEVRALMKDLGKTFRALPDWNAYILTSLPEFERHFGKSADKKKKLFNANLVCGFYSYFGLPPKQNDDN